MIYYRILQELILMVSCDFQEVQKLVMLVSSKNCIVHGYVFAYLGLRSGRDAPGIFWDF